MASLLRGSAFVEALGKIRAVAFDKTGTLTTGQPTIIEVVTTDDDTLAKTTFVESMSEHPIAGAIVAAARSAGHR